MLGSNFKILRHYLFNPKWNIYNDIKSNYFTLLSPYPDTIFTMATIHGDGEAWPRQWRVLDDTEMVSDTACWVMMRMMVLDDDEDDGAW